jgi:predicted P-loop ATPase
MKVLPTTIENVAHMLRHHEITIRYDVVKKKLRITIPGHTGTTDNADNTAITLIISLVTLNGMATGQVPSIVEAIADRHLYNPVAEWIQSKPWDGVDRLPALFDTLQEREGFSPQLKRILVYKWLLSAVAAAVIPRGFKARGVLTFQGPQGIGKTSWVMSLVSDALLREMVIKVDHLLDPHNKDSILGAITHWIVEIGELDSSFKKDVARLKGVLTSDSDKVRRPYAKTEYQRRTVFCATVNEENFLVDSTGNTRFWTLPLVSINYAHGIDMQQVFGQLALDVMAGAQWWLTPDEDGGVPNSVAGLSWWTGVIMQPNVACFRLGEVWQ